MAADGSISIDTKISTSGMNAGVKAVSNSFAGLQGAVKKTTQSLAQAFLGGKNFATIFKNIAKFAAAAFIGGSVISSIRNLAESFDLASSSIGDKVKPLSEALETLKGTFVNLIITAFVPLIPYLISAAQWFTNILVIVTQVVAALFGFKKTVGSIMTKAASDAKKAAKEAKGALAAFDQINLLQKQEGPETPAGPGATPGPITVPQDLLDKVQKIKDIIMSWFADPIGRLKETWGKIAAWFKANVIDPIVKWWMDTWLGKFASALWQNFIETWKKIIANTSETIATIKENIALFLQGINQFLTGVFTGDWALAWEGLKNIVSAVFGNLWAIITGVWTNILIFLGGWANAVIIILKSWASAINTVILDPIRAAFGSALDWVRNKFESSFTAIRDFVMGIINGILSAIAAVTSALGGVGAGSIGGAHVTIPHLATGAVLPPNAAFAAILGDQRSGKNIEAPEGLIRQIIREEMQGLGGDLVLTLPTYLDGEKIYQNQKRINMRHGKSLISGNR